jgi:hypothetical protein
MSAQNEDQTNYLAELTAEKDSLSPSYSHALRLLQQEIDRIQGKTTNGEETPSMVRLTEKVVIPVDDHPNFNFVGRLLGPRGLTLKRMQSETGCKMTILGRGSMRDKEEEDQLREGGEEKFAHLNEDLHVMVEASGTKALAQARLAAGVAELRKMMIPGPFAEHLKNEQLRELAIINGTYREPGLRPAKFGPGYAGPHGLQVPYSFSQQHPQGPANSLQRMPVGEQGYMEGSAYSAGPGSGNGYAPLNSGDVRPHYAAAPQEDWASDLTASAAVSGAGRLKMPATRMQQKKTYRDHPYQFP